MYRERGEQENHFDVIIIGAGPAGLFTAYELVTGSFTGSKILVVDRGLELSRRAALREEGQYNAQPYYLTEGEGGTGLFSDGKLSIFPAGSGLVSLIGERATSELYDYTEGIFISFGGEGTHREISEGAIEEVTRTLASVGIEYKHYPSRYINPEQMHRIVSCLRPFLESKGVSFRFYTRVTQIDVDRLSGMKEVHWANASGDGVFTCKYLVLATGKAGAWWLHQQAEKLGLARLPSPIEIGLRVEMPNRVLEPITRIHNDMKIKAILSDREQVRSFCTCAWGAVVACEYDEMILVSGHFAGTENVNFSLVTRIVESFDSVEYGVQVAKLANMVGKGQALIQRLGDLRDGIKTLKNDLRRNKVQPTLAQYSPGDIDLALPRRFIRNVLDVLDRLERVIPGVNDADNLVYAPVVELCWDKFAVNHHMQTNINGLYIVGDTAGHVRGLIQAAATGILGARGILTAARHETQPS